MHIGQNSHSMIYETIAFLLRKKRKEMRAYQTFLIKTVMLK